MSVNGRVTPCLTDLLTDCLNVWYTMFLKMRLSISRSYKILCRLQTGFRPQTSGLRPFKHWSRVLMPLEASVYVCMLSWVCRCLDMKVWLVEKVLPDTKLFIQFQKLNPNLRRPGCLNSWGWKTVIRHLLSSFLHFLQTFFLKSKTHSTAFYFHTFSVSFFWRA